MNDFEVLWRQNGYCSFCLAYWDFYQLNILELLEYPDSGSQNRCQWVVQVNCAWFLICYQIKYILCYYQDIVIKTDKILEWEHVLVICFFIKDFVRPACCERLQQPSSLLSARQDWPAAVSWLGGDLQTELFAERLI